MKITIEFSNREEGKDPESYLADSMTLDTGHLEGSERWADMLQLLMQYSILTEYTIIAAWLDACDVERLALLLAHSTTGRALLRELQSLHDTAHQEPTNAID